MDADPDFKTQRVYLPTTDSKQTHQQYLHDVLKAQLSTTYNILNEHIIPRNDKEIVDLITNRIKKEASDVGMDVKEYSEKNLINFEIEMMKELGYFSIAVRDANTLAARVFRAGHNLKLAQKRLETASGDEKPRISKEIKHWEEILKKQVDEYEAICNGDKDAEYIAHAYYRTSEDLLGAYLSDGEFGPKSDFFPETDVRHFTRLKYDLDFDSLDENVQKHLIGEMNTFLKNKESA
jgi:hypothetical protein